MEKGNSDSRVLKKRVKICKASKSSIFNGVNIVWRKNSKNVNQRNMLVRRQVKRKERKRKEKKIVMKSVGVKQHNLWEFVCGQSCF